MNRYHTIGILGFWIIVGIIYWRLRPRGSSAVAASQAALLGVLYRRDIEELIQADRPLPPIRSEQALPKGTVAAVVARSKSLSSHKHPAISKPKAESSTAPILPAAPNPQRLWEKVLETSDNAFVLTGRYQKDDIEFSLAQMVMKEGQAILSFRVLNESPQELFISRFSLSQTEREIPCQVYLPVSCRPGEEISGLVIFSANAVEPRATFDVSLWESGSRSRQWRIKNVHWPF